MELTVPGAEVERARAIAAGFYEGPLRDLVLRVKFHADPRPLPLLKDFLRRASDQLVRTLPTTIIAVPADRRRLRKRGVDLPALLAKDLALHLRVPFERNIVRKVRATSAQTSLDQKERRGNLEGAFEVVADPAEQNILVVDDVFTTGATAGVVTELLLCSGAHAVIWATLARTPLSLKVIEEP
ncbi:MAG TPA: phosphoribosyltransferase family protein [Bdellovibrionota bacterium]|nr:phosphoribosyltransferase family protein [Bdellovibrionota bacterium]